MALWNKRSGTKLAILQERITTSVALPVDQNATVQLLGGEIPKGMRLSGTSIIGTPFEVPRNINYRFVLRGTLNGVVQDRTFTIEVQGADEPVWVTPEDLLDIGTNKTYFILDSSPVDYQLQVIDRDTSSGQRLTYFIGQDGGELPPGISLTKGGKLVGVVDPVLALDKQAKSGIYDENNFDRYPYDFGIKSAQGFDSFYYDVSIYDFATPTQVPKKLNRYYQFTVSVTDGDTTSTRTFRIYVVGDDFLRADNVVVQVIVGRDEDDLPAEVQSWEDYFNEKEASRGSGLRVLKTSYNTHGGTHLLGGSPFRKNYASIEGTYDPERDAFISPKPFESWVLEEETCLWVAPIPAPEDGNIYDWDENSGTWINPEAS